MGFCRPLLPGGDPRKNEEIVKTEVEETNSSENIGVEETPGIEVCAVTTASTQKCVLKRNNPCRYPEAVEKKVSKIDLKPVYIDILPGSDPRTKKLPLFVVHNGPHSYHFMFEEISLDQFKPDRIYQLVCSNNPLCNCRILVKSILTTDVKSEDFETFENWEIVPPKRISSFKPHECEGPVPQPLVQEEDTAIASIESVVKSPEVLRCPESSQIIFSIKINDVIYTYNVPYSSILADSKWERFRPAIIRCTKFPGCQSSLKIFATQTIDPADEDYYTQGNWGILKGGHQLTHECLAENFSEIKRRKEKELAEQPRRVIRKHSRRGARSLSTLRDLYRLKNRTLKKRLKLAESEIIDSPENLSVEDSPVIEVSTVTTAAPRKRNFRKRVFTPAVTKTVSKIDLKPVYMDILPGRDGQRAGFPGSAISKPRVF